ncbi:MAG: flagellar hook-associated protein 3, partial [Bacillota bacterium]|nr:flagellar hook-associated protein 3 [Bacillota bacterium]
MRITMGMISSQYKGSLNSTLERLNNASNTATDLRRFNKASDDPYSAAMAFKLRREYQRNDDYQSNLSDVSSKLDTAGSAITKVEEIAQEAGQSDVIGAINGSMSETGRKAIAEKLRTMREAIVSSMNTELGGEFLFGGSENSEPPFTVDEAGNLLYRGVNVDTGLDKNGNAVDLDALG